MTLILKPLALIFALVAPAMAYDFPKAPGQRFDIGGYSLHIHCLGEGNPTVIIDAGLGDDSTDWQQVQQQSAAVTRTCVYDRPGYGWSDYGPPPRNSRSIVTELHKLLDTAGIYPPYVVVGHSFGGFNMRLFAAENPDEVEGLVLVDASHEQQFDRLDIKLPSTYRYQNNIVVLPKATEEALTSTKPRILAERAYKAARAEISAMNQSAYQVQTHGSIPTIPLVVISRGKAEWQGSEEAQKREKIWNELQHDLSRLSPLSEQIFAYNSGHDIQREQPELIVKAIAGLVGKARAKN